MTVTTNTIRTVASRMGVQRAASGTTGPRMHKAKDAWVQLKETRPPEGHPHVSSNLLLIYRTRDSSKNGPLQFAVGLKMMAAC